MTRARPVEEADGSGMTDSWMPSGRGRSLSVAKNGEYLARRSNDAKMATSSAVWRMMMSPSSSESPLLSSVTVRPPSAMRQLVHASLEGVIRLMQTAYLPHGG